MTQAHEQAQEQAPSAAAMDRFVAQAPGLRQPQLARKVAGLPTLPDLKKLARDRRDAGHDVIDQSAGDIDDVGQPLAPAFREWIEQARDQLVDEGHGALRRTDGDAFGFAGNYQQQYPAVTATLARSWGIASEGGYRALQTISGRTVIDLALRGLLARAGKLDRPPALILDPLAWSGYGPLASALGIELIHAPATAGQGLSGSAEGLAAALAFARDQGLAPIAALPIVPSNPTGAGIGQQELCRLVEQAAAADLPVLIDAFYSPLAPEGHREAVGLQTLEQRLAPEALAYLGVIVGETKVTSSQNKTGSLIWLAPRGHEALAEQVVGAARTRMCAINAYPRPQEALVAYALHTFPDGVHAAMGPRYEALEGARAAMRRACDAHGLPLSIGGSFYGTAALVDPDGVTLIRDEQGRPVTDPRQVSETLITRFGLVGAPAGMFSPAPEACAMVRLTAAVTLADVERVEGIFAKMIDEAGAR